MPSLSFKSFAISSSPQVALLRAISRINFRMFEGRADAVSAGRDCAAGSQR